MTTIKTGKTPIHSVDLYVAHLANLQGQIDRAITAISKDDIVALEKSLGEQEALCCDLKALIDRMGKDPELNPDSIRSAQIATVPTRELTCTYLLLLQHAGANAQQLYRLCRSYTT